MVIALYAFYLSSSEFLIWCQICTLISAEGIMEPYLRHLYTYVSLCGPHLGYLYSSNSLFNSGLWLLKKFKNTQCIHQLTLTDNPDLQKTFFYKLSKVLQMLWACIRRVYWLFSPHIFLKRNQTIFNWVIYCGNCRE